MGINNGNNSGNGTGPRLKQGGIHHANIKDKEKAVKRLKSAFRKTEILITLDKNQQSISAQSVLTEIMPKSAYIFTPNKLAKNTMLTIHLREPLSIDVRGRVRFSEHSGRDDKMAKNGAKKNFRTLIEYMIASESEREALEDFYQKVRDDNYVATKWHHYVTEKTQLEAKLKRNEIKIAEKVKEAQEQPELAPPEMLVNDSGSKTGGEEAA